MPHHKRNYCKSLLVSYYMHGGFSWMIEILDIYQVHGGKSRRGRMATTILTAHPTPTPLLALEGKAGKINFFIA